MSPPGASHHGHICSLSRGGGHGEDRKVQRFAGCHGQSVAEWDGRGCSTVILVMAEQISWWELPPEDSHPWTDLPPLRFLNENR